MIFLSLRVTADAEGGLKIRARLRPDLQGFGGGQPPTSTRRVYTGALLAATTAPSSFAPISSINLLLQSIKFRSRKELSQGDFKTIT